MDAPSIKEASLMSINAALTFNFAQFQREREIGISTFRYPHCRDLSEKGMTKAAETLQERLDSFGAWIVKHVSETETVTEFRPFPIHHANFAGVWIRLSLDGDNLAETFDDSANGWTWKYSVLSKRKDVTLISYEEVPVFARKGNGAFIDALHTWNPTISVGVESMVVRKFKAENPRQAKRAYAQLYAALSSRAISSMGDVHQIIDSEVDYEIGRIRIYQIDVVGLSPEDMEALNTSADRVLSAQKRKAQGLSMVDRIASMIPSLSFQVDGSNRSLSLLRRALRAIRHGRHSAALQARLESFSGQRMESWLDAIGSMIEVAA
jgi:hypothetical protein